MVLGGAAATGAGVGLVGAGVGFVEGGEETLSPFFLRLVFSVLSFSTSLVSVSTWTLNSANAVSAFDLAALASSSCLLRSPSSAELSSFGVAVALRAEGVGFAAEDAGVGDAFTAGEGLVPDGFSLTAPMLAAIPVS